ncbi:MAG: DUF554 domain-containing protein [Anaerolineae bacterium]|nr:DUF554 domain-containing protein [Anaerolineae bacterium]
MTGTILNAITVAIGSALGLTIGSRISAKIQESVITGLGLVTAFVGFSNAGRSGNIIIPLISLVSGVILGELLDLDGALGRLGGWLQQRFASEGAAQSGSEGDHGGDHESRARFVNGFVTASLVFCIGPLTFVGSIQDGMGLAIGFQQLAIKSVLDGFASMAFAASMGAGVAFSILTILILQGGLALAGSLLGGFMSDPMINEMTAVGGLMLMGMSLILLDLKHPRMANFLPALVIAPVIVAAAAALGVNLYPL